jgi:hypothetical protein
MRIRNLLVGLLLLGGLSYLAVRVDTMSQRIGKAVATGKLSEREVIWPIAVLMVQDKPMLGWAPVVNKYELAARLKDPDFQSRDTHNLLLEVLTATSPGRSYGSVAIGLASAAPHLPVVTRALPRPAGPIIATGASFGCSCLDMTPGNPGEQCAGPARFPARSLMTGGVHRPKGKPQSV